MSPNTKKLGQQIGKLSRACRWGAMGLMFGALVGGGTAARADTVNAKLTGLVPFAGGDLVLDGTTLPDYGVGELQWDGTGLGNASPFQGTFETFCIDLNDELQFGHVYSYTLNPDISTSPQSSAYPVSSPFSPGPMGSSKATELEELFGQHFAGLITPDDFQAFQLSVWNIVYDSDASVSSGDGDFYVASGIDGTAIGEANGWLAEAANPPAGAVFQTNLVALTGLAPNGGGVAQDQILIDSDIPISTRLAPLPAPAISGAVLMAGLAVARWRKMMAAR